jgi:hypothetical protein
MEEEKLRMNIIQRFLEDLRALNGRTTRNRHDRRKRKATEAVKESRGRFKYGEPNRYLRYIREADAKAKRRGLPPGFWKLWRME